MDCYTEFVCSSDGITMLTPLLWLVRENALSRIIVVILIGMVTIIHARADTDTGSSHPFVISGVVINSGASKTLNDFVAYLSQQSDYPMQPVFVSTYEELSLLLRKHPNAIGWTCGAPFVEDSIKDGQQLIGVPLLKGKPMYYSLVIRARGRKEQSLADFGGQVLAYSDPRSNSGFLAPTYSLAQQDIDIRKHFRLLLHAGNHERSIESLLSGMADVAAVDEYVWIEYIKNHPQAGESLEVIAKMGPYPFTPVVAGKTVSRKTINRLLTSLEKMPDTPSGKIFLQEFGLDGFVERPASFYQPIQNMIEKLNWPLE